MSTTKNTSDYTFAPNTPVHEVAGYFVDETRQGKDAGILVHQVKKVQGLALFGPQGGVITEDDLTPSIVEFIMSKKGEDGKTSIYEKFLVKKEGAKTKAPAAAKTPAAKTPAAETAGKKVETPAAKGLEKDDEDLM